MHCTVKREENSCRPLVLPEAQEAFPSRLRRRINLFWRDAEKKVVAEEREEEKKTDVSIFSQRYLFAYRWRNIRLHTIIHDDERLFLVYAQT